MSGRIARARRVRWRRQPVDRRSQQRGRPALRSARWHEYNAAIDRAFGRVMEELSSSRRGARDEPESADGSAIDSLDGE